MRRRFVIPTTIAVAILGLATTAVALALDGDSGTKPRAAPAATGTAETRTVTQQAEDSFIGTTAAHLCNVQLTVYDDPAALATAYGATSNYPGLTDGQIAAMRQRLATDAAFTTRLAKQLATSCRPPTGK